MKLMCGFILGHNERSTWSEDGDRGEFFQLAIWNHKYLNRIHKGFTKAENELSNLFETQNHEES